MTDWHWGLLLGALAAGLGLAARRAPILAWWAFTPLGVAARLLPPAPAAIAAAIAGAVIVGATFATRTLLPLMVLGGGVSALSWGAAFAGAAAVWPPEPAWGLLLTPAASLLAHLPLRLAGAPRFATNPLACTQERWSSVVHVARLGSDLVVTAAMGLSAGIVVVLTAGIPRSLPTVISVVLASLALVGVLGFGVASLRQTRKRIESSRRSRVAAVVCDGAPPVGRLDGLWPMRSPDYADVDGTLRRYERHVAAAAAAGAELIVLPEAAVRVDERSRSRWVDGVSGWARAHQVGIVAPYFDQSRSSNELVVIGRQGQEVARYEKQHPSPIEPRRRRRMPPGSARLAGSSPLVVSTVICVDLDYNDLAVPVARTGGVLAVPANDWPVFEALHHRTAVWAAVMSGVSLIRATGHGTCAAYDPTGRVVAQQSSLDGPVALVAEVPV